MSGVKEHGSTESAYRVPGGTHFATGNPGRPVGSKNKISNAAMQSVKSMKDDAIEQLKQKVANGDWQAILFVLDRVLPKGRTVELDGVTPNDIASMLTNGEITTAEAKDIAVALAKLAEVGRIDAIDQRIEQLEKLLSNGKA